MSEEIKDDFDAFDDEPTSDVKLTPRSLLAVVRAAEEGTPTESLADAVAKLKTDVATLEAEAKAAVEEDGDGATPAAKAPPAAKEAPSKNLGLSAEGEVQAIGVAMDLSSILYGYQTRTARVFYNAESASASKTAAEIRDQLDDATMGLKRINVEMIGTLSADASAVFETLRDAKPEPGGAVVLVDDDPERIAWVTARVGLDGVEASAFKHATGVVCEYDENGSFARSRIVSHE